MLLPSLNGLLVALFELPLSSITMRFPARWCPAAGFVLVGLGFALTALAHTLLALLVAVAIWTLGEMIGLPWASLTWPTSPPRTCAVGTRASTGSS